jgi:hypothetical protein
MKTKESTDFADYTDGKNRRGVRGCKEYQVDVSREPLPNLCNLRNLRIKSIKGEL